MRLSLSIALVGTLIASAPLMAQDRRADSVPDSHKPPAGMCRIWLPNVPASKQAAPTDCATAVRNRPANAKVIFGDPLPTKRAEPRDPRPLPLPLAPGKGKPSKTAPPPTPPVTPPPA